MRRKHLMCGMLVAVLLSSLSATAQLVVVPNSLRNTEGNSSSPYPFITTFDTRLQQVYEADQFPEPMTIDVISFRPDYTSFASLQGNIGTASVYLARTSRSADGLSTNFVENIGSGYSLVFSGPLVVHSSPGSSVPQQFDFHIFLQTPFVYDPALGNLLLEIRHSGYPYLIFGYSHDAESITGDSVSQVLALDSTAANGQASTLGLVTRFLSPATTPRILEFEQNTGGTGVIMRWRSHTNFLYAVESTTNSLDEFSALATNLPPTAPLNSYTDLTVEADFTMYRIEASQ